MGGELPVVEILDIIGQMPTMEVNRFHDPYSAVSIQSGTIPIFIL